MSRPEPCHRCGQPATAGANPLYPENQRCLGCAALARVSLPVNLERRAGVPAAIAQSPAWAIAAPVARGEKALWLHQADALHQLEQGRNVAVATGTASGKSLIFQLWTLCQLTREPQANALVFYPTKALANDQARRWRECCRTLQLAPKTVGRIDGDVPLEQRNAILESARILLCTPDVCHAWLLKHGREPVIRRWLQRLRTAIIDEAHAYEAVFGSNAAHLFRRLAAAARNAGAPGQPQVIAATATIRDPAAHLERLTGLPFGVVDEAQNGSPRQSRELYHLALEPRGGRGEAQLARLVARIIDQDPQAQVIAFHDSRQGVERVVERVNRPGQVLPYRSGYLAGDRRSIEEQLRRGAIRGVVATSALELGIDMPDLNYGVNLGLPASRKQFHQRLGRVGRRPGTFVLLAPAGQFRSYGETLRDYYENSVELSHLYLGNEYINRQQARCLRRELEQAGRDSRTLPEGIDWPPGFAPALEQAHDAAPSHLSRPEDAPHLAHGLRSSGEENLQIIAAEEGKAGRNIGYVSLAAALAEAYPGAVYRHRGKPYRVIGWARRPDTRQAILRATPDPENRGDTRPLLRRTTVLPQAPDGVIRRRERPNGGVRLLRATIIESVEGYEAPGEGLVLYRQRAGEDARLSRKQRDLPTTAVWLQIQEPWFTGAGGTDWQAREQLAQALRLHLAYHRSIPLPDLGAQVENLGRETPRGYALLEDSLLVYDNIHGGIGLVEDLYRDLDRYAQNLKTGLDHEPGTVYPEYAAAFRRWLERTGEGPAETPPGPENWWLAIRRNSPARLCSERRETMLTGVITGTLWRDGALYRVGTEDGTVELPEGKLQPAGGAFDRELWQPATEQLRELPLL